MKFRFPLIIAASLMLAATAFASGSDYESVLRTRRANRSVTGMRPRADGDHYTTLCGNSLVRYSYAARRDSTLLFTALTKPAHYTLSPSENMALFADAASVRPIYRHSFTADYSLAANGECRNILQGVRDVTFSPDGKQLAYAFENNLYLYDIATGRSVAVTDDGRWNEVINGTSDWVYEEEYGFTQAYAFSPSGDKIAYLRFDEREVPLFEMMRYDDTLYNRAYTFKYPKAGDKNSLVELWLYDVASAVKQRVDVGPQSDQYILNVAWTPGGELYFYRVNRLQNHFEVVLVCGDGSQKVIYEERSAQYVERPSASTITFLDKERFIVREETTTGWMHLYLHTVALGRVGAITEGEWEVTSLVAVDGKRAYYISTEPSPLQRALYVVGLNGRGKRRLSEEEGFVAVAPAAGMKYYVQTVSSATAPNVVTVHRKDGTLVDTLVDSRADVAATGEWSQRLFKQFTTERGDVLNYYVQLPRDFDPAKRYPVLMTQYSGPGSQSVRDRWSLDWEDAMVERGYIVACCDGRGTGFRGEAFKKCTYGDLGRREREDQISFARYLATMPYVDAERIGIYGWSYGGFMALNCALHGEGLFRMAIAVAPVTSWRYYDTIYTEIYNGLPQDNPVGYDDNSPLQHAEKLSSKTRLLIIHGTADDNVHFQNSMEMARRLNAAGKQYDMMVYPDQNHSMMPSCTTQVRQKMIEYTTQNL